MMNYCRTWAALIVIGMSLMGCGSDDGDSKVTPEQACQQSCVASMGAKCSAEVDRPASDCEATCMMMFAAFRTCESQMISMIHCSGLLASSGWECNAEGESNPRTDVCSAEQAAVETCTSK
jgi:hypothetical protein